MTAAERTDPPWYTRSWSPLEGGRWKPGILAEYSAWVGTPPEIVAQVAASVPRGVRETLDPEPVGLAEHIRSPLTDQSPHAFARERLERIADRADTTDLVAVVWEMGPMPRWDGQRNQGGNPDHALAIVTSHPSGGDEEAAMRQMLLAWMRTAWAEQERRTAAVHLYRASGGNIRLVHRWSGMSRSTVYSLLRSVGIEPTER